jgi:hypothetical protein
MFVWSCLARSSAMRRSLLLALAFVAGLVAQPLRGWAIEKRPLPNERADSSTYLAEVMRARDDMAMRWPDRKTRPLTVWIQRRGDEAAARAVREAFSMWGGVGLPVGFAFVDDSASAEVHLTWVNRFREPISGRTLWSHDSDGWILAADIILAVHHRNGEPLDAREIRAIALHEIGHLVGLDHTRMARSIMSAVVEVETLAPIDIATARALYSGPAGRRTRS